MKKIFPPPLALEGDLARIILSPSFAASYFLLALAFLTLFFGTTFKGIQGDGVYYYSYTVSILWDGDLDLKNQFDRPDPRSPQLTVTRGLYGTDERTGRAFSLFNPGTGILMLPAAAAGRLLNGLTGNRHTDPFDFYYQRFAAYTAVILSSLTLLLLFVILKKYASPGVAAGLPFVSLLATNWLFYATAFASWAHVYALFLQALLIWSFLRLAERRTAGASLVFGLAGGLAFSTRNFSVLMFLLLFGFAAHLLMKKGSGLSLVKAARFLLLAGSSFLAGAAPQLLLNAAVHGSPFRSSFQASFSAEKLLGVVVKRDFRLLDPANFEFLYSNLWNADNGLFFFHPFFLIGLAGVFFWIHRDRLRRSLVNLLLAGLYGLWFLDAAYFDSWFNRAAGSGFGHRRFLDVLPLFVFGAANVLEISRVRKVRRRLASVLFSLLTVCGIYLFYNFLVHYQATFALRDSFPGLYGRLILNGPALLSAAAVFLILTFLVRPGEAPGACGRRSFPALALFAALAVLPAVIFRPSPVRQRARFQDRRGFFLMYSLTPLVRLPSRYWGFPENMTRRMLFSRAEIELPAPLEQGDSLLFKISAEYPKDHAAPVLNVFSGGGSVGRLVLKRGKQICFLAAERPVRASRILSLQMESAEGGAAGILFHEGRIVFHEWDDPPYGFVDLPAGRSDLAEGAMDIEGWALDDRGVEKVVVAREPLPGEDGYPADPEKYILLGSAEFRTGTRPDVESTFVLCPDLDRSGWIFSLDRRQLPDCGGRAVILHVLAYDNRGQRSEIGRKEIICK